MENEAGGGGDDVKKFIFLQGCSFQELQNVSNQMLDENICHQDTLAVDLLLRAV